MSLVRKESQSAPATVAVLGAGVIGTSVAHACLRGGHRVLLVDQTGTDWAAVHQNLRRHDRLARLTGTAHGRTDLTRLTVSDDLADVSDVPLVIENVTEGWETKKRVYAALRDAGVDASCIAANTSAISIGQLASEAPDPSRIIGVHFMNPVSAIDLVEVVRATTTSDQTLEQIEEFLSGLNKTAIVVGDRPGFVINRILMTVVNQAARLLDEQVADVHDIDQLLKGCLGHRMGPLRTADLIGIDTVVRTLHVLQEHLGPLYVPADRLVEMVDRGDLGMKTARGFYDYTKEPAVD